jgi:hypothetical protein
MLQKLKERRTGIVEDAAQTIASSGLRQPTKISDITNGRQSSVD